MEKSIHQDIVESVFGIKNKLELAEKCLASELVNTMAKLVIELNPFIKKSLPSQYASAVQQYYVIKNAETIARKLIGT